MTRKFFQPGVYDISNEDYHASAGISRSAIKEYKKSAKHYWYKYINPDYKAKTKTPELIFGSAFHCYVLEPHIFDLEFHVAKKFDKRTTAGKEAYAKEILQSSGKTIIEQDDFDTIIKMNNNLIENNDSRELLTGANYEKSIFWIDPETGILCKCRPDVWHTNFIVDLKTTNNASFKDFQRDFYYYDYCLQIAMIQEGIKHSTGKVIENFIDLAIEKEQPHCHAIYPIDEKSIQFGLDEFRYYLLKMKECFDNNTWPSYETKILSLPGYAKIGDE